MSLKLFDIRECFNKTRTFIMSVINCSTKRKLKSEEIETTDETSLPKAFGKKQKTQKVVIPEPTLEDTEYYIDNGLRKVYPYFFTYYSHSKGRWMGQPLAELFAKEFRAFSLEQIKSRIDSGLILVNNERTVADYKIKGHDILVHKAHRHELPVLSAPIPIIHLSKDMVVIDKPPSIPIHPTGKYRHNTIMSILHKENELDSLHTIHRLDRLTSGVLLIARSSAAAQKLHEQMKERELHKEYVSRVVGKFPDGVITCEQPIETIDQRIGINIVANSGKPCMTTFERLNYNGKSSTVLCRPKTGRMHQIRVHLQYLGHPIVNDKFYNNEAFGPHKGKNAEYVLTRQQIIEELGKQHQRIIYLQSNVVEMTAEEKESDDKKREIASKALLHYTNRDEWIAMTENYKYDSSKGTEETDCDECLHKSVDPNPYDLLIYLHALSYKGPGFEYRSQLPIWAKDDWDYD